MRNQLIGLIAATALLTACSETLEKETVTSSFDNLPSTEAPSIEDLTPGSAADFQKSVQDTVHFAFDSSEVSAEAKENLLQQAEWLKKWSEVKITLEGHCDVRGTVEYNIGLGERRANAAKMFLVQAGIDASRIEVVSHGKEHPINPGMTEEAHAQNRRATTVIG